MKIRLAAASLLMLSLPGMVHGAEAEHRPNILFICIDDLRPQLGCYGEAYMKTPNLDRLAQSAAVFERHYVSVPTCGPSRASMLTGLRPLNDAWYSNSVFESLPRSEDWRTHSLPGAFKAAGYTTVGIGKISHNPSSRRFPKPTGQFDDDGNMTYAGPDDQEPELAHAWDRVGVPTGAWGDPWSAFFGYAGGQTRSYTSPKSPPTEAAEVSDSGYPDGLIADEAVRELRALQDKRFFLAVGFFKPHLPFCAPKRYWDLYDPASLPLAPHPEVPEGIDEQLSLHPNGEMTGRYDALENRHEATEAEARHLRHGYFAAVSYVDAQVGKVLDELDCLGLAENTIVVVWGDHGWHLGDLHVWGKHTAFEYSLRSALLMRVPGAAAAGKRVNGIVESVDLFPTLADYCQIDAPDKLPGRSLRFLMDHPTQPGKDAAWGYWNRGKHKALTLRTDRYRLTRWTDPDDEIVQVELYDHLTDPHESRNVAYKHPVVVSDLLTRMPH